MKTRSLIIAGALLFALGVAAGTLLVPRPPATPPSNAASATGSTASSAGGDSAPSDSASADSGLSGDFGARLQQALFGSSQRLRDRALATLADGLTPAQILAALQRLQKLSGRNRSAVLSQLLGQWALTDPKGATQYAMALTRTADRDAALSAIAAGWAEADPKAAEAWALSLPDAGAKDAAIVGLIGTLASADPKYALTLAQGLPPAQAASCESAIFGAWVENDPQGAAAEVAKLPAGSVERASIKAFATAWSAQDSASAMAWVLTLGSADQQYDASTSIAAALAPDDPEAVANFGLQLAGGHGRYAVLDDALESWMSQDPAGALNWLQQLPDADRSDVAGAAARGAQLFAPAEAVQIALLMPPGDLQSSVLQQSGSAWYLADPNAVMAWARQQTDPQVQASVVSGIASRMAGTDVQGAISLAQGLTGDARVNTMNSVIATWAGNDPAAAAAYVTQEPDGQEKNEEAGNVAYKWESNDPAAANQWLASLPAGATKDDALQNAAASADPDTAETLLAGISNDQARMAAETQVATDWMRSNPAAAKAWIQSSNLPQQTKDYILGQH